MGLRVRASVLLALTVLVLVAVFALLGMWRTDEIFDALDRRDAGTRVTLVTRWFDDQARAARGAAEDMAASTAAVGSVSAGDDAAAVTRLTDTWPASASTEFVILLDDDGRVTAARFLRHGELEDEIVAAVREDPRLTAFTTQRRSGSAIMATTVGPAVLGLAPVPASEGRQGDSGTVLVTGRFLDTPPDVAFTEATGLSQSAVTWFSPRQSDLPAGVADTANELVDSGQLVVIREADDGERYDYGLVDDPLARPAAIVRIQADPAIQTSRGDLLQANLVYLLIFLVAVIGALVIVLDTSILHRLSSVLGGVREVGGAETTGGVRIPVEGHDEIADLAASVNDILETIDRQHERVLTLQTTDALTRVCNRSRFLEEVRRQLEKSKRLGERGALLWFDLDDLKRINDAHGLAGGDLVLVEVAKLLSTTTRTYCTVGRVGGDDFAVLDPGADRAQAARAAERLLNEFGERSFEVDGHRVTVSVSIGVACYPEHGESVEALLEAAEDAKDTSRREGGGRVTVLPGVASPSVDRRDAAPADDPEAT